MATHVVTKGLDLPMAGAPEPRVDSGPPVSHVALLAGDYPFMKPRMHVEVGDKVKRGQLLFEDRKTEGVRFTAPGAGTVVAIHRGARRALISVVIELTPSERQGGADSDQQRFASHVARDVRQLTGEQVRSLLVESGLWTALRTRPFSKVPVPTESCTSVFVTALDSQPHAPDLDVVLADRLEDFRRGVWALSKLTDGPVFVCRRPGSKLDGGDAPRVRLEEFTGPHPAGLAGTHIHTLDPVGRGRFAWYVGAQDVAAIGRLVDSGRLDVERVVALAGPAVRRPRLLRTRLGADLRRLTDGELADGEVRVVSGSVLGGRRAGGETDSFLGRYHQQVSVLNEGRERAFVSWLMPGLDRFSTVRAYASSLRGSSHRFSFTTTSNGGHRAMVPIGMYERVMPLDIMPTFLLRALVANDLERAEALGCLELDEEDLALCTFVCPGKEDYGSHLRRNLFELWKEE